MINKVIGILIILIAGYIGYLVLDDEGILPFKNTPCVQLTPAEQLVQLINDDFHSLAVNNELPVEWSQIATIQARMNSTLASAILGKERPFFKRVQDGTSYLELEFIDVPDEEDPGIIIQASLFDIKSQNKIFEIGRTYKMEDLNNPPSKRDE